MKTYIAIPCMDSIATPFFRSYAFMNAVGECGLGMTESTLVYDARNKLASEAINGGYEYVLWLDSDMVFEADLMERLFDSIRGRDFVSGLYFTRRNNVRPCIFSRNSAEVVNGEIKAQAEYYLDYPEECIFEIAACGFGAVLMKTKMLTDVYEKFGLPFNPAFGLGEDLAFCYRARQLGYKLWCDSSIKLGHVMHTVSDEDLYRRKRSSSDVNVGGSGGSFPPINKEE